MTQTTRKEKNNYTASMHQLENKRPGFKFSFSTFLLKVMSSTDVCDKINSELLAANASSKKILGGIQKTPHF